MRRVCSACGMVVFGAHLLAFEAHVCRPVEGHPLVLDFITPDDHPHEDREVNHRVFARQVEMESSTGTFVVVTPNTGVLTFEGAAPKVTAS